MRETLVRPVPPTAPAVATDPANGVNPAVTPKPKRRRRQRMWRMVSPMLVARVRAWVLTNRRTGISAVARGVKISHAQAVGALKELETQGVVGPIQMGRNGREILVSEEPRAASQPRAAATTTRLRSARNPRAKSRARRARIAPASPATTMPTEISLSVALGMADLPQQIAGLKQAVKLMDCLFRHANPVAKWLRTLAAILAKIEEIRKLATA